MEDMKSLKKEVLNSLETPCLVVDYKRMENNIDRIKKHLQTLGVKLRPHMKTAKSVEIANCLIDQAKGSITVSTLKEAEVFADWGIRDIIYAVGISPQKLERVRALRQRGVDVIIILDSVKQAKAVASFSEETSDRIPVLIEIDCDGHRSGILPQDKKTILQIASILTDGGAEVRGILTHAGESYSSTSIQQITAAAENERISAVQASQILRNGGFSCSVVSVGSTPTAHFAQNLNGITEVRAGVFVFFDLVMAGIGVCSIDDIALSVLTTVIGHQRKKGWIIVDAGWMAMSRDRGTAKQAVDYGYGLVCNQYGIPYKDLFMVAVNQEHGILTLKEGSTEILPELAVGTLLRILPNHACATASQFDCYHVMGKQQSIVRWARFNGW